MQPALHRSRGHRRHQAKTTVHHYQPSYSNTTFTPHSHASAHFYHPAIPPAISSYPIHNSATTSAAYRLPQRAPSLPINRPYFESHNVGYARQANSVYANPQSTRVLTMAPTYAMQPVSPVMASYLGLDAVSASPILPPTWLTPQSEDRLQPGVVVEFLTSDGDVRIGIVSRRTDEDNDSSGPSWMVTECPEVGINSPVTPPCYPVSEDQISFVWPLNYAGQTYRYTIDGLVTLRRHIQELVERHRPQLAVAWGSCIDRKQSNLHVYAFAWMLFPDGNPRPHELYVAHRLLQDGYLYFEQTGKYQYKARPFETVEYEKKLMSQKSKEEYETALFLHRLHRRLRIVPDLGIDLDNVCLPKLDEKDKRTMEWNPVHDQHFLEQLKHYALSTPFHPPSERVYDKLLKPLSLSGNPEKVFSLLVKLGVVSKNENPHLARFPHKLDFTPAELKHYAAMSASLQQKMQCAAPEMFNPVYSSSLHITSLPPLVRLPLHLDRDANVRRDLRRLGPLFAIDNSTTTEEIDDAICLEERSDGTTWVYVHIADPSRFVLPNDELDMLARKRVQSVFLPEKSVTMFPPPLARNHMSLLPGKINFALSYGLQFDSDGNVISYEIMPSVIGSVYSMTYDQADALIRQSPETLQSQTDALHARILHRLKDLAMKHRKQRILKGAVVLDMPRAELSVKNNGDEIELHVMRDTQSPSRTTVAELMVVVGEVTAMFAKDHNIPIPYRSQRRRNGASTVVAVDNESGSDGEWEHVLLKQLDQLSRLGPTITQAEPAPHHGVGVEAYCQATSPIRRYSDLLVHQQVKSVLRNELPPFDQNKIQDIINQLEGSQNELSELSHNSHKYWLMRYLEHQDPRRTYMGLVTGLDSTVNIEDPEKHAASVLFLDLGWRANVAVSSSTKRGDTLRFIVSHVDAFAGTLDFAQCAE